MSIFAVVLQKEKKTEKETVLSYHTLLALGDI